MIQAPNLRAEDQPAPETPDWMKDAGSLPADTTSPEPGAEDQPAAEAHRPETPIG